MTNDKAFQVTIKEVKNVLAMYIITQPGHPCVVRHSISKSTEQQNNVQ